jgi:hypothetical protein
VKAARPRAARAAPAFDYRCVVHSFRYVRTRQGVRTIVQQTCYQ